MADFHQKMADAKTLTDEEQVKTGAPIQGKLSDEHLNFLKEIKRMVDMGEIDIHDPKSFLKRDVYDALDESTQDRTDVALMNIARLLKDVYELYINKQTPDESPQYTTMINQLWEMKQRIEDENDVFKF